MGQLQMRGDTLVTGGSDGSVRVWSLEKMCPIHRLAAHDNSVTSLQFDDTRVVSGGSDGRVKIWDLKTGHLVRELIAQGEAVWRVAFEDEKCVALALRHGRTVMEVSFVPFRWFQLWLMAAGLVILPPRRDALRSTTLASTARPRGQPDAAIERHGAGLPCRRTCYRRVEPGVFGTGCRHAGCWPFDGTATRRKQDILPRRLAAPRERNS